MLTKKLTEWRESLRLMAERDNMDESISEFLNVLAAAGVLALLVA